MDSLQVMQAITEICNKTLICDDCVLHCKREDGPGCLAHVLNLGTYASEIMEVCENYNRGSVWQ